MPMIADSLTKTLSKWDKRTLVVIVNDRKVK